MARLGGPPDAIRRRASRVWRNHLPEREPDMTVTEIDTDKLMSFVFKAVDEVGATLNAALVVMGDKLGYYRDLAAHGPTTAAQLAERTETAAPYAREWLNAQAAG